MSRRHAKILGYIVTNRFEKYGAFELGWYDDSPPGGVLLMGDCATMFTTANRAYAAIRRTRRYEKARGFDWGTWALRVQRVIPQGPRR